MRRRSLCGEVVIPQSISDVNMVWPLEKNTCPILLWHVHECSPHPHAATTE